MKSNAANQPITYQPAHFQPPESNIGMHTDNTVAVISQPVPAPSTPPDHESLIRSDISIGPLLTGLTLLILMRRHR